MAQLVRVSLPVLWPAEPVRTLICTHSDERPGSSPDPNINFLSVHLTTRVSSLPYSVC